MKIAVGSDEKNDLTQSVLADLRGRGHDIVPCGPLDGQAESWPVVARRVAELVASGQAAEGILFCWTGTGVSIAANKIRGVRAALCVDAETARGARLWNNANVLCMSLRLTSKAVASEILASWFSTEYQPNREDDACLRQLRQIESDAQSKGPLD